MKIVCDFNLIKAVVFPVVMYGCENQTIKKAECQRIDTFELVQLIINVKNQQMHGVTLCMHQGH